MVDAITQKQKIKIFLKPLRSQRILALFLQLNTCLSLHKEIKIDTQKNISISVD